MCFNAFVYRVPNDAKTDSLSVWKWDKGIFYIWRNVHAKIFICNVLELYTTNYLYIFYIHWETTQRGILVDDKADNFLASIAYHHA